MPVILALDIGEKRTGVAVGSTESGLARPHSVLQHKTRENDVRQLKQVACQVGVDLLLVGYPVGSDGGATVQGERIRHYAEGLAEGLGLPLQFWNEAFSSKEAQACLLQAGRTRKHRRLHEDAAAAAVILQEYLDSLSRGEA